MGLLLIYILLICVIIVIFQSDLIIMFYVVEYTKFIWHVALEDSAIRNITKSTLYWTRTKFLCGHNMTRECCVVFNLGVFLVYILLE